MTWIRADLVGEVTNDHRILVETRNLTVMDEERPDDPGKVGIDEAAFERIRRRTPGPINTPAFVGGATAFMVELSGLALLDERLMKRLHDKYGAWSNEAIIMLVRNTAAGGVWNALEPAGGMAEDENLALEALREACEVGIHNGGVWLPFLVPNSVQHYQIDFNREQAFWWKRIAPTIEALPMTFGRSVQRGVMMYTSHGRDIWNGIPCIVGVGPVGDAQITRIVNLALPEGDWRVVDCECRPGKQESGEPDWVPLRRKAYAIVKRVDSTPLALELAPNGGLHEGGLHVILDGENIQHALTHVGRSVLEALGWI